MAVDDELTEQGRSRRAALKSAAGVAVAAAAGVFLLEPAQFMIGKSRKKVRYWHELGGEWLKPMESILESFNRSQDTYEMDPLLISDSEADSKMMLSTVGGEPPDVVLIWTLATSEWADSGLLHPLDSFMTPAEMAWFKTRTYPVVRKSGWFKGNLYGLVMGFDLFVCFYRPDHFRQAGLDPDKFPETLEELVEVGDHLHKFNASGDITRMGFLPSHFDRFAALFGGGFYNENTGALTLNTPENLRALNFLADCRKRFGPDGFKKVIRFESGLSSDDGASWPFIQGNYSILVDGEWRVEQLHRYKPDLEYRTIPVPPPKGGKKRASFAMTNFLVMPKGARCPDGAWEFIRFWTGLRNPAAAAQFYPLLGWMPLSPDVTHAPQYQAWLNEVPQYRSFLDVAESDNIRITPPVPFQLYLMDQVQRTDDYVSRGTLTPEKALVRLEHDVAHELERRRRLGYAD